jgi:hypothetical protein
MPETSPPQLFSIGRIVGWVIIALMLVSIVYSAWISLANWSHIMV